MIHTRNCLDYAAVLNCSNEVRENAEIKIAKKKSWTPKDSDILEPDMKRSVYLELVGHYGTAMSLQEVAEYMGCGDDTARKAMIPKFPLVYVPPRQVLSARAYMLTISRVRSRKHMNHL